MAFTKIVDSDLTDIGVIGLPDRPGLSTSAMQAKLEETARSVIIPKHNNLINELEATTGAASLGIQTPTGMTGATVQAVVDDIAEKVMQLDPESLSSKADKVTSAVEGNFAGLDSEGNLTDSGNKAADFAAASHTHTKSDITDFPTLATVATTGAYADLSGQPTLGTASALDVPASGNASSSQVVKGNDSRLSDDRNAADVYSWAKQSTKPSYTASEVGAIASTEKGANGGVAELDSNGKVPSSQLPSYVDDVEEYASLSAFPATGETGKIYIAKDTNKTYRWSGTAYVEISESLALGETSSTAYAGNKGKANADAISAIKDGATIDSFGDVETALGDKQPKTLATAITVDGTQETTVEGALGAINTLAAGNKTAIGNIKDGTTIDSFADVETALSGKQDTLTFDNVPTASSNNPVKSGGVYDADKATRQLLDDTVGWTAENLFNRDTCTEGYIINSNGVVTESSSGYYSDYISVVKSLCTLKYKETGSSHNIRVHEYDSSKTWLRQLSAIATVSNSDGAVNLQISDDAKYIRISAIDSITNISFYHATVDSCKVDNTVIAPVEDGAKASQRYTQGQHFQRNGGLYTVSATIAENEDIVEGTNCVKEPYAIKDTLAGNIADLMALVPAITDSAIAYVGSLVVGALTNNEITGVGGIIVISKVSATVHRWYGMCGNTYLAMGYITNGAYTSHRVVYKDVETGTITPETGITVYSSTTLRKVGKIITLNYRFEGVTVTANNTTKIASLPQGFYPSESTNGVYITLDTGKLGRILLNTSGDISVNSPEALTSENVVGSISWIQKIS